MGTGNSLTIQPLKTSLYSIALSLHDNSASVAANSRKEGVAFDLPIALR